MAKLSSSVASYQKKEQSSKFKFKYKAFKFPLKMKINLNKWLKNMYIHIKMIFITNYYFISFISFYR